MIPDEARRKGKTMLILGLVALVAVDVVEYATPNPLAEAANGKIQCYGPNAEKRTCKVLATYVPIGQGLYTYKALSPVPGAGSVTIEVTATVTIKDGAECGAIRAQDIKEGRIRNGDRVLGAAESAPMRSRMLRAEAPLLNKEVCTRYVMTDRGMLAESTFGGVYMPEADMYVEWVEPGAGYKVAP